MTNEVFLQMLSGIDGKLVEKASEDMVLWQEAREGVSVSAGSPRRSSRVMAAVSAVCAAAVVIGIFVLILNVRKNGIGVVDDPTSSGSSIQIANPDSENGVQTFSKNFDGLILTVTTDKSTYTVGEQIKLTATLENRTGEDIYFCCTAPHTYSGELKPYFEDLIEYPYETVSRDAAFTTTLKQGEKYVQDFTFLTYTAYIENVSETGSVKFTPDYSKPAATGVYNGKLTVLTFADQSFVEDVFQYTLDFSVTVYAHSPDSENPSQIFTEDYDGLVITVTTDKTAYNIGEPIELTATLENRTGKDVTLWYPTYGTIGYDGQPVGTTAELKPRFDDLIEYPVRSAVWIDDAISTITFKKGNKCTQHFTFQTYTGYIEIESSSGEFKDAVIPDLSKLASPGGHKGTLNVITCIDESGINGEISEHPLNFWVTINSQDAETSVDGTPTHYPGELIKDYFIYDGVLYTNCYTSFNEWFTGKFGDFDLGKEIGEPVTAIKGKADLQAFEDNTANVLPIGTEICEFPPASELLIAKAGSENIPYMPMWMYEDLKNNWG